MKKSNPIPIKNILDAYNQTKSTNDAKLNCNYDCKNCGLCTVRKEQEG